MLWGLIQTRGLLDLGKRRKVRSRLRAIVARGAVQVRKGSAAFRQPCFW
jgi:hypothetical protein